MGAGFDESSFINEDLVGAADCTETMRDGDGCAVLGSHIECCLHDALAPDIDCACCFVEDEDSWTLDDGTGNGETLSLAP